MLCLVVLLILLLGVLIDAMEGWVRVPAIAIANDQRRTKDPGEIYRTTVFCYLYGREIYFQDYDRSAAKIGENYIVDIHRPERRAGWERSRARNLQKLAGIYLVALLAVTFYINGMALGWSANLPGHILVGGLSILMFVPACETMSHVYSRLSRYNKTRLHKGIILCAVGMLIGPVCWPVSFWLGAASLCTWLIHRWRIIDNRN